jgi:hypothetical protein
MNPNEIKPENTEQNQAQVVNTAAQPQQEAVEPEPQLSDSNKANWKLFREQKELERKQRLEAERIAREERERAQALQAALEAAVSKSYQQPYQVQEDETEEQRIEKKVNDLLARREQENERRRIEREQAELPQKLQSNFSDFSQVCNSENLDYLDFHYPEIATPFKHMPDSFEKWSALYKAVKRLVPNPDSKKDMQKIEKNLAKPQSMSAPGTTQGGNAMSPNRLTEERRASNWERMQRTIKGLS